jgi:integrase
VRLITGKRLFSTTHNYKLDFESINPKTEQKENQEPMMISTKNKDYMQYFPRCKKSTKRSNASGFKKFCLWSKKTPEELINEYEQAKAFNNLDEWERKKANKIIEFYQWLRKQLNPRTKNPYSSNYCNTVGSAVLAFYHQNCKAIEGVMDTFAPTQLPTDEYRFTQDDLRKMFHYGDTQEKAMISLAICYGQGAKDFLGIEAQKLRDVIDDAKRKGLDFAKWVGKPRKKTGIQPISFLTPEAIESVDAYLKLLEKKKGKLPRFIWCNSRPNKAISGEGLNKRLRKLVEKSNINIGSKRVRFHCIRKFTFSRLRRIDKDMAKIICAKSVSVSDMTYEELEDQAEKVFRLAYRNLALNGNLLGTAKQKQEERLKEMEDAIVSLSKDLHSSKVISETLTKRMTEKETVIALLQENMQKLEDSLNDLKDYVNHTIEFGKYSERQKQALREKYGIKEFNAETKELLHTFQDMSMELQGEKGYLTPKESKELDRRFQAYLKEKIKDE